MKTYRFLIITLLIFSLGCQKERKHIPRTLQDIRDLEILKKEKAVEACKSPLEKILCKDFWYLNWAHLDRDTLIAKKDEFENAFPILFSCDGNLFFNNLKFQEKSSWNRIENSLELKFENNFRQNSNLGVQINAKYKITKVDSILTLILIDRKNIIKRSDIIICSDPEPIPTPKYPKVTSKLLPNN